MHGVLCLTPLRLVDSWLEAAVYHALEALLQAELHISTSFSHVSLDNTDESRSFAAEACC